MVVCQFFLEGRCRFGQACRNQHPANAGYASQGGGSSWGAGRGGTQWGQHRGGGGGGGGGQWNTSTWNHGGGGGRGGTGGSQWGQPQGGGSTGGRGGGGALFSNSKSSGNNPFNSWRGGGGGGAGGGGGSYYATGGGNRGGGGGGAGGGGLKTQNPFGVLTKLGGDGMIQQQQQGRQAQTSTNQGPFSSTATSPLWGGKAKAKEPLTAQELLDVVKNDMVTWEQSNMWPLSCYTFAQRLPCLEGFSDVSFEETRWAWIQAKFSNTIPQHEAEMNQAGELHRNARQLYATGHPTVEQHLLGGMQLYNSILTQQKQQQQAQPSGAGLFGNAPSPPHQNTGVHSTDVQSTGGGGGGGGSGGGGGLFQQSLAPASTQQPATSLVNPFLANARSSGVSAPSQKPEPATSSSDPTLPALTDAQMQVFRGKRYGLGEVPEVPPPMSVCH